MDEKQFLKELGIDKVGSYTKDGSYAIDIKDSNEWGKIYSLLDKSDAVEEDGSTSSVSMHEGHLTYYSIEDLDEDLADEAEFEINLIGDFDSDIYSLVIKKL